MKYTDDQPARKRPVNLTLNEDLVRQARSITDNLSGVVESLLKDFVARKHQQRLAETRSLAVTIATWNDFGNKVSSFADEYSTL